MKILLNKKNSILPQCAGVIFCALLVFSVLAQSLMVLLQLGVLVYAGVTVVLLYKNKQSTFSNYLFFSWAYIFYLTVFHFDMQHKGVAIMAIAPWSFLLFPKIIPKKKAYIRNTVFLIGFAGILLGAFIFLKHDFSDKMRIGLIGNIAVNSNIVSYIVGLGSMISLYFAVFYVEKRRWIYFLCTGFALYIVYLCQSRGALLSTVIGEFVLLYYGGKNRVRFYRVYRCILVLFCLMCIIFIIRYSLQSKLSFFDNNGRVELWKAALDIWRSKPFFGNGVFIQLGEHPSSHNLIFDVLMQSGIIGLVLILGLWITVFMRTKKESRAFFCFALLQAMIDTRQYYMLSITLMIGLLTTCLQRIECKKELKK